MTEKDKELISQAESLPWWEYALVSDLEQQAESEEAKERLHSIAVAGYHREEAEAGMI